MAKEIQLRNGGICLVDDEDFEWLSRHRWYCSGQGYAIFGEASEGIKAFCKIHRLIMNAQPGQFIDHIDRNKLNNQRSNLRFVTRNGNAQNHPKKPGANKFIGVQYINRMDAYQSRCRINGQDHFLGYFKSEIAAAYAYNKKARELSREANINTLLESAKELETLLESTRLCAHTARKQSKYKFIYFKPKGQRGSDSWYISIAKLKIKKFYLKSEEAAYQYLVSNYSHHFEPEFNFLK